MLPQKILLVRPDRAGDALKTLPALRALLRQMPQTEVRLLTTSFNDSIFSFEPNVKTCPLPLHWEKLNDLDLGKVVADLLGGVFDVAIGLPADAVPELKKIMPAIPALKKYSRLPESHEHHHLAFPTGTPALQDERKNIAFLIGSALGIPLDIDGISNIPVLSTLDRQEALEHLGKKTGKWYALSPFAGEAHRHLTPKMVLACLDALGGVPQVEKIFISGGPTNYEALQTFRRNSRDPKKIQIVLPSSFRALAAYLERADGVIGAQSGPLHLSIAMGLPTLGFLGGCDLERWYPDRSGRFTLLQRGIFDRFRTRWGVQRHLKKWLRATSGSTPAPIAWQAPIPVLF